MVKSRQSKNKLKSETGNRGAYFDREEGDRKKIRLAYWALCIASLSLTDYDRLWKKIYDVISIIVSLSPTTLSNEEKKKLQAAANAMFDAETRTESPYQHIDCLCRKV